MKKHVVLGFKQPYIADEVNPKDEPQEPVISIEEELVAMIFDRYQPVDTLPESTEQKTTAELIEEMESMSEVYKSKVVMAMKDIGFKSSYTGHEFVWLLKER